MKNKILKKINKNLSGYVIASLIMVGVASPAKAGVTLNGAGASFPYPIYSKWFDEYHKVNPDVKINYQSIGSGGGIRQVTAKTVDFGATDGPMSDKNIFKVDGKIHHIPTVLGAVVPVFNLPGINDLNLSGPTLANIFLGKITQWNDPEILKDNPGVNFPESRITVVYRSDGSGTTYSFSDFLSLVSPEWKKNVGTGNSLSWPTGIGGKGNEGVAGLVQATKNSIGYVGYIYAASNNISHAAVRNKNGEYIKASVESISAAAAGAADNMPADYRVSVANAPGQGVYPISTFTWLLIYDKNPAPVGTTLKNFLEWMLDSGQKMAPELGYAPLPENVKAMVKKTISTIR